MTKGSYSWECECGFRHGGNEAPEECPECQRIDSFIKVPNELLIDEEIDEELNDEELDYD